VPFFSRVQLTFPISKAENLQENDEAKKLSCELREPRSTTQLLIFGNAAFSAGVRQTTCTTSSMKPMSRNNGEFSFIAACAQVQRGSMQNNFFSPRPRRTTTTNDHKFMLFGKHANHN